jgi:PEP-CTERM motif
MQAKLGTLLACLLGITVQAHSAVIFGNSGLNNGSRWDASPRNISGNERSLDGGLRYSLQGGSYEAYRDIFNWSVLPSVVDFTQAIQESFAAWTVTDPVSGLGTALSFIENLSTPVGAPASNVGVNISGAEIDLLGETNGVLWNAGDSSLRAETFFDASGFTTLDLTSGTTNYPGFAISGADVKMNSNPGALWNLTRFQTILTHELGHAIGLGDVDTSGNFGNFIDDNYNGSSSATAFATLTNSWAGLVNPLNPAASPLGLFNVASSNSGVDTPGVDILMETIVPAVFNGNPTPLQNDDFGGRQFLYPALGGTPPAPTLGPIVEYRMPQSWDGVSSVVADLSPESNNGSQAGSPALSASNPPGAGPGTSSLDSHNGGILTDASNLLSNFTVAASGGFQFELDLFWDGSTNQFDIQKIIDYAGTEFLQLENTGAGLGDLRFGFNDTAAFGPVGAITANQWHHVVASFDTLGNTVDGSGDLAGLATLTIDGVEASQAVFKSNFGDGLNRPIGFGTFAGGLNIIDFQGLIFNPVVSLGFPIIGDLDGDGFVGIADLNIILGNWNQNVPPGDPLADLSGDGFVGIADLNVVLGNWNAGTPPAASAVPEPATLGLIALGGLAMLKRRR